MKTWEAMKAKYKKQPKFSALTSYLEKYWINIGELNLCF